MMNTPIIDPATLTKEQREAIKAIYNRQVHSLADMDTQSAERYLLESLFGWSFFIEERMLS